jgi:hypothetical protein
VPPSWTQRRRCKIILTDPTVAAAANAAACAFTPWQEVPNFSSIAEQTALPITYAADEAEALIRPARHVE